MDGCFDLCHSGHFNAIRQARNAVHTLCIGPNSDQEILTHKGPTILTAEERNEIVGALKWGDEIIKDTPYATTIDTLDSFNCQYYIHGDDPVMADGVNVCIILKEMDRFKEIRRTTGISTTDLTGRLLKLIESHQEEEKSENEAQMAKNKPPKQTFLQTSARISQFSNRREPSPGEEVVYI